MHRTLEVRVQTTPSSPSHGFGHDLLWNRLAHAHVEGIVDSRGGPPRALVVGTAGSGKTRVLRHLRERLARNGSHVTPTGNRPDFTALPPGGVVVVDDAHLLSDAELTALSARLDDENAGLILACRPWPRNELLRAVGRELEKQHPVVLLGHVSGVEVREYLAREQRVVDEACVTAIVEMCGSATWLVLEALTLHGYGPCPEPSHRNLRDALHDVIAERLETIDPGVAARVRRQALGVSIEGDDDGGLFAGHAEGLLLRNGRPVPIVRTAVLATTPVDQIVHLVDGDAGQGVGLLLEYLDGVTDPRVADTLLRLGDTQLTRDPSRAAELFRSAESAGADTTAVTVRQGLAEWARGDIDAAGVLLDSVEIPPTHPSYPRAVDTVAAVWAARGLMDMSDAAFVSAPLDEPLIVAHAAIAALGAGDREAALNALAVSLPLRAFPSAAAVSMRLLSRGLRGTLAAPATGAVEELVRAAATYTESGTQGPLPDLPAVLAAITAVNLGELDIAHNVLTEALRGNHGGSWARPRLLLWAAWVALRRQRPVETETRLANVQALPGTLSARDRLLRDAVVLAYTRRYGDSATLRSLWQRCRDDVMRVDPDLYSIHPLTEFVVVSALMGDAERLERPFQQALRLVDRLGSPPAWSAHLHWAGIQREILRARPDALATHAHALVAAAPHNHVAAAMATAGRTWTDVLTGTVDPERIEAAAVALADVGLAWDAARLASHGAGHAEDRRVISRLLSAARQLHPQQEQADGNAGAAPRVQRGNGLLSAREMEVAALVVQGKTYAEIGETIFISPRTAEHHIARIRRRLGATSRSDLIGKLRTVLEDADHEPPGAASPATVSHDPDPSGPFDTP
ncbi:MAG: LuxR C-terminal-related transcriptional regulator [Microbacterium sp.]|uniref:LuxR C-terminal-related transcriptional regulator n=1 Tax=Microbacterium sp. TaxID=51671 RepID=UPI002639B184|nr:LuxR C-terminal-related transcriptional regulator [Microbacterium sp.]MCX6501792.1 LuxR C-terminal-related transcriptional regulator [Microbacterium sp.]